MMPSGTSFGQSSGWLQEISVTDDALMSHSGVKGKQCKSHVIFYLPLPHWIEAAVHTWIPQIHGNQLSLPSWDRC